MWSLLAANTLGHATVRKVPNKPASKRISPTAAHLLQARARALQDDVNVIDGVAPGASGSLGGRRMVGEVGGDGKLPHNNGSVTPRGRVRRHHTDTVVKSGSRQLSRSFTRPLNQNQFLV